MVRRLCVFASLLQNIFVRVASRFKRTTGIEIIAFQNFGHVGLLARWDNRNARLLHVGKSTSPNILTGAPPIHSSRTEAAIAKLDGS
jgi:hypothetical protein